VLLKFTVEERGGEIIEAASPGNSDSCLETRVIAVETSIRLPKYYILQKSFKVIAFLVDYAEVHFLRVILKGVFAPQIFLIWMYIRV